MKIYKYDKMEIIASTQYFHGSYHELPPGTILTPERGNFMGTFNKDEMDSHFKLEQFRPSEFLSRNNAIYMCKNIDDIDLAGGATEHIYIIEPIGKVEPHDLNWMSEIDLIISDAWEKGTIDDEETIEKVKNAALNYWHGTPHYNESVWEYLSPSAKVIKKI
ncbi:MAG: hypothetical protein ACOCWG_03390 [bacterium]